MFRSATVEDFQSVKSASLEFPLRPSGGSITTIVGPSSTGKSAFLRALHTLVFNTNSVSARVRAGAKTLKVATTLADGREVRITRGPSLSTYEVGDETYTKAGTTAPEVIANIFRLQPDLHIRFQFSPPYLLSEPPNAVAATFARLTHAHLLREAVREGQRRALRARQAAELRQAEAEKISSRLAEEFADIEAHRDAVTSCALLYSQMAQLEQASTSARTALLELGEAQHRRVSAAASLDAYSTLPDLHQRLSEATEAVARYKEVGLLVTDFYAARSAAQFTPSVPDLSRRFEDTARLAQVATEVRGILEVFDRAAQASSALRDAESAVELTQQRLSEARSSLKVCPTCQRPL